MVKSLASPYAAGRRGRAWQKVKPVHTLDLVVLGAEWGYGRRTGWLSNLHLGARDPDGGEPIMVGKTFKGLTDALLQWQTDEVPRHERSREERPCICRPNSSWRSNWTACRSVARYPGGVALRFARVVRYRPDKTPPTPTPSTPCGPFCRADAARSSCAASVCAVTSPAQIRTPCCEGVDW